jgi:hypothetical protein
MVRLTIGGVVPSVLGVVWRAVTCAQIYKEVLGMMEGGIEPRAS